MTEIIVTQADRKAAASVAALDAARGDQVRDVDRELFITLSKMAERILCGEAFTWEVDQIARLVAERDAAREELAQLRASNRIEPSNK